MRRIISFSLISAAQIYLVQIKWGEGLRKFLYQVYKVQGTIDFARFLAHMQDVEVSKCRLHFLSLHFDTLFSRKLAFLTLWGHAIRASGAA